MHPGNIATMTRRERLSLDRCRDGAVRRFFGARPHSRHDPNQGRIPRRRATAIIIRRELHVPASTMRGPPRFQQRFT